MIAIKSRSSYSSYAIILAIPLVLITMQFRDRAYDDKSFDFQVILRLLSYLLMLMIPFIYKRMWKYLLVIPRDFTIVMLIYFIVSAVFSPVPIFSAFNAFSIIVGYIYATFIIAFHGENGGAKLVVAAGGIICIASLVVWAVNPEIATMKAWDGYEIADIGRLRGLTGSANGLGAVGSLTSLFIILFRTDKISGWRYFSIAALSTALICLVMSNNRMAILSLMVCLWLYFVTFRLKGMGLIASILGLGIGVVVLLLAQDLIFSALSRSGNASEITSGTGRAEIWSVVIELWTASPFIGYGYSSANSILPLDPRLFSVAAHAHNMYLEILFSGGFIGIILFFMSICAYFIRALAGRNWKYLIILVFFMLRGFTEASPFAGVLGFNAMIYMLAGAAIHLNVGRREGPKQVWRAKSVAVARRFPPSTRHT